MLEKRDTVTGELVEKSFIHYLPVVIVGILICGVPSAILNSCAGIFYPVIAEDFGVTLSQVSMWRTINYIFGVLIMPFAGFFFVRYNAKIIVIIAAIVESLSFVLFGLSPEVWVLWIGGALTGMSNAVLLGVSIVTIINRWFKTNVGLIIGICTAFTGIGGIVFSPIAQALIDTSGWRFSYIALGVFSLVVMTLGVLFLFSDKPEKKGLLPYGTNREAKKEATSKEEVVDAPCVHPNVAKKSILLVVLIIFAVIANTICNVSMYFPTYVAWFNEQPDIVAGILVGAFVTGAELNAFISAGNAAGKLGLGFFSDLNLNFTLVLLVAVAVIGVVFMWFFPNTVLLPIGGFLFGCFVPATLVVTPMIVRACFGSGASYPIIYSWVSTALGFGGAVGSYFWAVVAENLGGFDAVFSLVLVCLVVVLVLGFIALRMKNKLPREHWTEEDLNKSKKEGTAKA